jgi:hypothetical protein
VRRYARIHWHISTLYPISSFHLTSTTFSPFSYTSIIAHPLNTLITCYSYLRHVLPTFSSYLQSLKPYRIPLPLHFTFTGALHSRRDEPVLLVITSFYLGFFPHYLVTSLFPYTTINLSSRSYNTSRLFHTLWTH